MRPSANALDGIPDFPVKRDESHWVSDGNVVLYAESNREWWTYVFRIHKSLLKDNSEVFESMFNMPQGVDEGWDIERCEGLPLVRLPDSAEEV